MADELIKFSATLAMLLVVSVVGVPSLFYPRKMRDYFLEREWWRPFKWVRSFMESEAYIWNLRFCGVVALFMALVCFWALLIMIGRWLGVDTFKLLAA